MTPEDLQTPPMPDPTGSPRVLFGFSAAQAMRELERCHADDVAAYRQWRSEYAFRLDQRAALVARRDTATVSMDSVRATAAMLRAELARARRNAQYVEKAAEAEVEREIAELRARHAGRMQEAQRLLVLATQRRADLETALARAADRLEATARDMIDAGTPSTPQVTGEDGMRRLLATLAGSTDIDVPAAESDVARRVGRVPLGALQVRVTTRGGDRLGTLTSVVRRDDDLLVIGYEVDDPADGRRWIAADDVIGVDAGVLTVRERTSVDGAYQGVPEPAPLRLVADPTRTAGRRSAMRRARPGPVTQASGDGVRSSQVAEASVLGMRLPVPALLLEDTAEATTEPASAAAPAGGWQGPGGRDDLADWLMARPEPVSASIRSAIVPATAPTSRASALPEGAEAQTGSVGGRSAGSGVASEVLAFMNGKVVGQDIVAADGHVVARRGERIDAALVDRVEHADRLPELIVYMTFDDA